ncbi:hypothetical protein Vadar_004364 [Vaccinium darrowii]|uniref:Uncharacterized protein n=1 Tax=Vaccinium darrowii TaxID=229202 RepID=A0ACB7X816_9ERIC|nr:hypothetical protein Vadar_004364 [Vaccinium darrowii]
MDISWCTPAMHRGMFFYVCREIRIQDTSWIDRNPGRRYMKCPNIVCDDSIWIDPPMCARSKQIILGLLRRIHKAEGEIETSKLNERKLWVVLAVCVVWIGMLLFKS